MNNKAHFVVYDKPDCIHCKMLLKYLKSRKFNTVTNYYGDKTKTNLIDIESTNPDKANWSKQKIDKFKNEGFAEMPVVRVYDDHDKLVDTFTGFNISEITKLAKQYDFTK